MRRTCRPFYAGIRKPPCDEAPVSVCAARLSADMIIFKSSLHILFSRCKRQPASAGL